MTYRVIRLFRYRPFPWPYDWVWTWRPWVRYVGYTAACTLTWLVITLSVLWVLGRTWP